MEHIRILSVRTQWISALLLPVFVFASYTKENDVYVGVV